MGHKVVINTCFGGFGLSEAAEARYNEIALSRGMDEIESVYRERGIDFLRSTTRP